MSPKPAADDGGPPASLGPPASATPADARPPRASVPRTATPLNNTGRVLLGMIAEGHVTGYAIKAEIERSTRLYWGASIGGIYPELRRLEAAGLVTVRDNPRGGARRHAYALTAAGRGALAQWLTEPATPAMEMRHEALLRLRFAGVLPRDSQLELVAHMRALHADRANALRDRLAAGGFDDPLHQMTVEFGLGFNEWAIGWCDDAARRLRGLSARRGTARARRPGSPG